MLQVSLGNSAFFLLVITYESTQIEFTQLSASSKARKQACNDYRWTMSTLSSLIVLIPMVWNLFIQYTFFIYLLTREEFQFGLVPMEEVVRAFNYVIDKGWAFYWATSDWSAREIEEAHRASTRTE
jgi:hypothetical protein